MSFSDRLVLWLHIAFAIFALGPVALAISSTPRYIRRRELPVLRYLSRITVIFTFGSLLVLIFGIVLGQLLNDFAHPWLTAAMTLFLVSLVLLALVIRDQRRAIRALAPAGAAAPMAAPGAGSPAAGSPSGSVSPAAAAGGLGAEGSAPVTGSLPGGPAAAAGPPAAHLASVERGRIAAIGGVVNLIWLAILVLMVWQP